MSEQLFNLVQSLGIIAALIVTLWQVRQSRKEIARQRYLETDRRYVEFLRECLTMEDPPVGYRVDGVREFLEAGGTKQELILYDILFSTCESAFLLYQRKRPSEWEGWSGWLLSFFRAYPRCFIAWTVVGGYFEKKYVNFVTSEIVPRSSAAAQ